MAIENYDVDTRMNQDRFQGLSTDEKPTTVETGSRFYELDTGKWWVYSENNENPATSSGWWEV